jgi:hypothetical protein
VQSEHRGSAFAAIFLMKSANNSPDRDVEIVEFMTEFARFLLAAGVPRTRFSRIVEFAYFQAASQDARFQNQRLNQSAVAAMTGLTRNQVRVMLRRKSSTSDTAIDRVDRIIGAWTSDAEYVTASFAPRRLRISGPIPSFQTLVDKVGGDIPYRSMLRELERLRMIAIDGRHVSLTKAARSQHESRSLRHLASALSRVIQTTGESTRAGSSLRAVTVEVDYPAQSATGRILMQRRLTQSLKAFMADVEAAGAAVAIESPSTSAPEKRKVSQARVLLITSEKIA